MTTTRTESDRTIEGLYAGLLPVERARLLAGAFRDVDEPQIARLEASTPPQHIDAFADAARILCRLRYPLAVMAESVLARAERDLARLVQPMFEVLLGDLDLFLPEATPARAEPYPVALGAGGYSHRTLLKVLMAVTAGSYVRVRVELAAIAEVIGEFQRDVFGGEDPLPPAIWEQLQQAEETVAAIPELWACVAEGFAVAAGIGELPALEEPDPAAIAEEAAIVRRILTHDGWL